MTGPYVEEQQHLFVLGRLWPQRLSKFCSEYFANVVRLSKEKTSSISSLSGKSESCPPSVGYKGRKRISEVGSIRALVILCHFPLVSFPFAMPQPLHVFLHNPL